MNKIRQIMLTEYIGAVTIGFLLANAITTLIGGVIHPILLYWEEQNGHALSAIGRSPFFAWETLVTSVVSTGLYAAISYLLLRWLYLSPDERQPTEDHNDA